MEKIWIGVLCVIAAVCAGCQSPTGLSCVGVKRAEYAARFGKPLTDERWLLSDVWRIDPVTTVYFSPSCVVTVTQP